MKRFSLMHLLWFLFAMLACYQGGRWFATEFLLNPNAWVFTNIN